MSSIIAGILIFVFLVVIIGVIVWVLIDNHRNPVDRAAIARQVDDLLRFSVTTTHYDDNDS